MFLILFFIVNNFYLNSHWIYSALKDFFVLFICVVHNVMLLIYIDFWPHFRNIVVYRIRNKPFLSAIYYLCGLFYTLSASVTLLLMTTKMACEEEYLNSDVLWWKNDGNKLLIYLGLRNTVGFKMFDKYIVIIPTWNAFSSLEIHSCFLSFQGTLNFDESDVKMHCCSTYGARENSYEFTVLANIGLLTISLCLEMIFSHFLVAFLLSTLST